MIDQVTQPDAAGYIKLWRCISESEVWQLGPLVVQTFIWLVLQATHRPHALASGVQLEAGQLATSYAELRQALGYRDGHALAYPSLQSVKDTVRLLEEIGAVEVRWIGHADFCESHSAPKSESFSALPGLIISICDYKRWLV